MAEEESLVRQARDAVLEAVIREAPTETNAERIKQLAEAFALASGRLRSRSD